MVTLKDTALGFIITYPELLFYAKQLGTQARLDSPIIPATIVAAVIYIALCLILSLVANTVEKRLRRSARSTVVAGAEQPTQEITDTELIALQKAPGRQAGPVDVADVERDDRT